MREEVRPSGLNAGTSAKAGPLFRVRLAPSQSLWRVAPAWAVVAAALASGASLLDRDVLLRALAAVVLADAAWGMLRLFIPVEPGLHASQGQIRLRLPYTMLGAPLAQLAGVLHCGGSVRAQELAAGAILAIGLSLLLGLPAVVITACAMALIHLARTQARAGKAPAFCLALLDVALPWALGATLAWQHGPAELGAAWPVFALAAAHTLLQWAFYREHTIGLWLGQAAVVAVLLIAGQTWALAAVALLLAPAAWWLASQRVLPSLPWWWAAMLVSGFGLR